MASIQQKRMEEFRGRYRNECDGLLIDDVQFSRGGKARRRSSSTPSTRSTRRTSPIVLTSDVLPQNLHGMAERLCSRFASGLVAEVYPPELETRIAILRKKAEQDGGEARRRDRGRSSPAPAEQRARAGGDADEAVDPGEPRTARGDRRGLARRPFASGRGPPW
ncbi:MAG: hypothetical protein IPF99_13730 [Deltaproteobacteria bacterium]|nr:hypothetical protein [Deltaproteobacteria bacterium]